MIPGVRVAAFRGFGWPPNGKLRDDRGSWSPPRPQWPPAPGQWTGRASAGEAMFAVVPAPRLVALGKAGCVATYRPVDDALPPDRVSVRAIVAESTVDAVRSIVAAHDGTVTPVRANGPGVAGVAVLQPRHAPGP